ncbi:MAG: hypothetical protein HZA01_07190 [Nitrospinae bacterium]|nr:hypothetical protein [Nitrospinota bacterium]
MPTTVNKIEKHGFQCPECGKKYTDAEATRAGSFCESDSCIDSMILLERINVRVEDLLEKTVAEEAKAPEAHASPQKKETPAEPAVEQLEIGLGILMCDTSGSMEDYPIEGQRVTKMKLVAGNVARGIWDLVEHMADYGKKRAFIALCGFNKEADFLKDPQGKNFIKSVEQIGNEFASPREFSDYIFDAMRKHQAYIPSGIIKEVFLGKDNTKFYTNITAGLEFAHKIKEACLNGDLSESGGPSNIRPVEDVCLTPEGESVNAPNIRCLIYSDGAHNYPTDSDIENPFDKDETSVLMTAFFGKKDSPGYAEMKGIACACPKHGAKGAFLINCMEEYHKLRGLFRMSSGASGFCGHCLPRDI